MGSLLVRHGCRFFVRALAETGPTGKAIYKRQMRVLEGHFYEYEVAGGAT